MKWNPEVCTFSSTASNRALPTLCLLYFSSTAKFSMMGLILGDLFCSWQFALQSLHNVQWFRAGYLCQSQREPLQWKHFIAIERYRKINHLSLLLAWYLSIFLIRWSHYLPRGCGTCQCKICCILPTANHLCLYWFVGWQCYCHCLCLIVHK